MRSPGFTADASLYPAGGPYRLSAAGAGRPATTDRRRPGSLVMAQQEQLRDGRRTQAAFDTLADPNGPFCQQMRQCCNAGSGLCCFYWNIACSN